MATAKKGKKTSKPKKASKPKKKSKKNNSMGFFGKFMLILLLVAVLIAGVFTILKNIGDVKVNETTSQRDNETTSQQVNESKSESKSESKANSQQPKANSQKPTANSQKPTAKSQQPKANSQQPKANSQQSISGSWLSTEQGASLTIDDYGYRIDFFGVDASRPITGKVILDDKNITFTSDEGVCKGKEGKYKITFNKKDIRLICKDDDCIERRSVLEAEWEWMEI